METSNRHLGKRGLSVFIGPNKQRGRKTTKSDGEEGHRAVPSTEEILLRGAEGSLEEDKSG